VPFEVEVELQDTLVELALEAMAFLDLPLSVDDGECDVFVRSSCVESDRVRVLCTVGLDEELRRCCFIEQVGVENVEFIPLDNFWRGILAIVMGLVVFVPLVALLD